MDALRTRVAQEAAAIRRMETLASLSFNKATLLSGIGLFAIGSLAAAGLHTQEHPLSVGAKLAAKSLSHTKPFGTVVVTLGPSDVPDDVNLVPVSQWARESRRSEAEIVAALKGRGHVLMTPETFSNLLDRLQDRVLKGSLTLPVARAKLLPEPADADLRTIDHPTPEQP